VFGINHFYIVKISFKYSLEKLVFMLSTLKFNLAAMAISGLLVTSSITAPLTSMFGKHYIVTKDFVCCKQDKLVVHHYYTINVFWVQVANGYTEEKLGKSKAGACNIRCSE